MILTTEQIEIVNKELKNHDFDNPWANIRFRKSTTGKGYMLQNVPIELKVRLLAKLFEDGAKVLVPVAEMYQNFTVHFTCDRELAVKLANTFPPPSYEDLIPLSQDGKKILTGKCKERAVFFQTLFFQKQA